MNTTMTARQREDDVEPILRYLRQRVQATLDNNSVKTQQTWNHVHSAPDMVRCTIPVIAKNSSNGLGDVSVEMLQSCIQPILDSMRDIDAEALLSLKRVARGGAPVERGVRVEPIHEQVLPPCEDSVVRYVHLSEVPDQYSMGIFVFPPHAKIPLHDHPGMCVLSRLLYGNLQRLSLDLAREEDQSANKSNPWTSWGSSWRASREYLPEDARLAYKHHIDYLSAPDCTVLFPYEGNLHEFVAGPQGAAVLDILLPPYDVDHHRDCTFYDIRECSRDASAKAGKGRGDLCWIVPTGQPEDFHCVSGVYQQLGSG